MKKRNNLLALLLAFLLLFTACGASTESAMKQESAMAMPEAAPAPAPEAAPKEMIEVEMEMMADIATSSNSGSDGVMSVEEVQTYAEKIIYSGYVNMETTYFDDAVNALDRAV